MKKKRSKPQHLLIVRLSAMGDVAIVAPVVASLRAAFPDLRITLLTRERFAPFFRDIERIDFFFPDFTDRHKGFWGIFRLWKDLRPLKITQLADLHDVLRTKLLRRLMRLGRTTYTVINKGRYEKKLLTRKFRKEIKPLKPTIERYHKAITRFGYFFVLPETATCIERPIPAAIALRTGQKSGIWVGFAPFAKHRGKIYPTAQADEVIGLLAGKYKQVFLFGGGVYERDFTECMEKRHGSKVVSVIGRLTLPEEMDLIANLDVVVTMDSAMMHIASNEGTPVISVWGATHPYAGFYAFGQPLENAVRIDLPCRPCSIYGNRPCIYGDYRCLARITPAMIFASVQRVIKRKKRLKKTMSVIQGFLNINYKNTYDYS